MHHCAKKKVQKVGADCEALELSDFLLRWEDKIKSGRGETRTHDLTDVNRAL